MLPSQESKQFVRLFKWHRILFMSQCVSWWHVSTLLVTWKAWRLVNAGSLDEPLVLVGEQMWWTLHVIKGSLREHGLGTCKDRCCVLRGIPRSGEFLTLYEQSYDMFYPGKIFLLYEDSETWRENSLLAPAASKWNVRPGETHLTSQPQPLGPGGCDGQFLGDVIWAASDMTRRFWPMEMLHWQQKH